MPTKTQETLNIFLYMEEKFSGFFSLSSQVCEPKSKMHGQLIKIIEELLMFLNIF